MQGRTTLLFTLLLPWLCSCTRVDCISEPHEEPEIVLAQDFDVTRTGTIQGRVTWEGDAPVAESKLVRAIAYHPRLHLDPPRYETPHIPKISTKNGVADVVVFLRQIEPSRARPWDHAKVRVEFRARQMQLYQGSARSSVGFVLRGGRLETMNHDSDYHALRGRGAAFFTLPLIRAEAESTQKLGQAGLVELFDAAGYYWSHAHVFVVEHPYYTRTDSEGQFTLEKVPAGEYDIVNWMPSWHLAHKDIDPETAVIARLSWQPPQVCSQSVQVQPGRSAEVAFRWTLESFPTKTKH